MASSGSEEYTDAPEQPRRDSLQLQVCPRNLLAVQRCSMLAQQPRTVQNSCCRLAPGLGAPHPESLQGKQRGPPAWKVGFQTWKPGSAQYDDVDAAMDMQLTTLYFFCNRPTVAALMAIGTDLGDAFKDPCASSSGPEQPGMRRLESTASFSDSEFDAPQGGALVDAAGGRALCDGQLQLPACPCGVQQVLPACQVLVCCLHADAESTLLHTHACTTTLQSAAALPHRSADECCTLPAHI